MLVGACDPSRRRKPVVENDAMMHPLNGADPITLLRVLRTGGPPRPAQLPALAGMLAGAGLRGPLSLAERGYVAARRPGRRMPPPIFILGHWRSGTTHLFNLLSGAPRLAYAAPIPVGLPWDFLLLGRAVEPVLKRLIPTRRGIDPMAVTPTAPQEDEIALASMTAPSYYHGVYKPRAFRAQMARGLFFDGCTPAEIARWQRGLRLFTEKVSLRAGGARVLVKNPAHTAKVAQIRAIWPEAKFIHIVRDPHHVYQSTHRMFADLLDMLALQDRDAADVAASIDETYPRMLDQVASDLAALPSGQWVEARFEELEANPLGTVARIAAELRLEDPEGLLAAAQAHLDSVAGYRSRTREVPPEVAHSVERLWGRQRARLGYPARTPDSAPGAPAP